MSKIITSELPTVGPFELPHKVKVTYRTSSGVRIEEIDIPDDSPSYEGEGGYLIPEFIAADKPGIIAKLWRLVGRICKRTAWYERGRYEYNMRATLERWMVLDNPHREQRK